MCISPAITSHHITTGVHTINMTIPADMNLDQLAEVVFAMFLSYKFIPHTPILKPWK